MNVYERESVKKFLSTFKSQRFPFAAVQLGEGICSYGFKFDGIIIHRVDSECFFHNEVLYYYLCVQCVEKFGQKCEIICIRVPILLILLTTTPTVKFMISILILLCEFFFPWWIYYVVVRIRISTFHSTMCTIFRYEERSKCLIS